MNSNKDSSFALVTRLQKSETPYLNEFLEYYKNIGINKFYLINTEPNNEKFIDQTISPEFKDMICLFNKKEEDNVHECTNIALPHINETFLMHIDMDEFLYLDGMTLDEFVESEKFDRHRDEFLECSFRWVMTPLYDKLDAPSIKSILEKRYFFPSKNVKSLYYTKDISVIGEHKCTLKEKKKVKKIYNSKTHNCFVFHVSSRGILDIINKILFSQFNDLKNTKNAKNELDELIFNETSTFLPNRFILLAFQSRFSPYVLKSQFDYPKLRHQTDIDLLREITFSGLNDLLKREVSKKDLEKLIYNKMDKYPIDPFIVYLYAKRKINLFTALEFINKNEKKATYLFSYMIYKLKNLF